MKGKIILSLSLERLLSHWFSFCFLMQKLSSHFILFFFILQLLKYCCLFSKSQVKVLKKYILETPRKSLNFSNFFL